jgi:hypothetical protein
VVNQNPLVAPGETAQDVWDYLEFAGFHLTREQLIRIHQRRVLREPFLSPSSWRDPRTTYEPGTAERILKIAQLKAKSKHLDELAWRLWWDGVEVDPTLVRDYLTKMAKRWDERLSEFRKAAAEAAVENELQGERDVLDEVFFKHLKPAPSVSSLRKRLGKGSDIYVEFAGLLIDLLRGDFSVLGQQRVELFALGDDAADDADASSDFLWAGRTALQAMQSDAKLPYAQLVGLLDEEQIDDARPVARLFTRIIASFGEIMHDGFGGTSRDRDTVGNSLVALSESPEEQVLSLLLTSSFLKDVRIRASLPHSDGVVVNSPAVSYEDYLRLRYLAKEIPGLEDLVTPKRMREAFDSPDGAERWRASFEEFRLEHFEEFEEAMAARPDLFGLRWREDEEFEEIVIEEVNSKKKN